MGLSERLVGFNWKKWWLIWAAPLNFLYITANMLDIEEIFLITTLAYYLFGVAVAICTLGKGVAIIHRYFTLTSAVVPREKKLKAGVREDKLVED